MSISVHYVLLTHGRESSFSTWSLAPNEAEKEGVLSIFVFDGALGAVLTNFL